MKRLLYFTIFILLAICVYAIKYTPLHVEFVTNRKYVPIYLNPYSSPAVSEDTIVDSLYLQWETSAKPGEEYDDSMYYVYVTDVSPHRFQIVYKKYTNDIEDGTPIKSGWIDKKHIVLGAGNNTIRIYSEPSTQSDSIVIQIPDEEYYEEDRWYGVLDYLPGTRYIKIIFTYKDTFYEGWINRGYIYAPFAGYPYDE